MFFFEVMFRNKEEKLENNTIIFILNPNMFKEEYIRRNNAFQDLRLKIAQICTWVRQYEISQGCK